MRSCPAGMSALIFETASLMRTVPFVVSMAPESATPAAGLYAMP